MTRSSIIVDTMKRVVILIIFLALISKLVFVICLSPPLRDSEELHFLAFTWSLAESKLSWSFSWSVHQKQAEFFVERASDYLTSRGINLELCAPILDGYKVATRNSNPRGGLLPYTLLSLIVKPVTLLQRILLYRIFSGFLTFSALVIIFKSLSLMLPNRDWYNALPLIILQLMPGFMQRATALSQFPLLLVTGAGFAYCCFRVVKYPSQGWYLIIAVILGAMSVLIHPFSWIVTTAGLFFLGTLTLRSPLLTRSILLSWFGITGIYIAVSRFWLSNSIGMDSIRELGETLILPVRLFVFPLETLKLLFCLPLVFSNFYSTYQGESYLTEWLFFLLGLMMFLVLSWNLQRVRKPFTSSNSLNVTFRQLGRYSTLWAWVGLLGLLIWCVIDRNTAQGWLIAPVLTPLLASTIMSYSGSINRRFFVSIVSVLSGFELIAGSLLIKHFFLQPLPGPGSALTVTRLLRSLNADFSQEALNLAVDIGCSAAHSIIGPGFYQDEVNNQITYAWAGKRVKFNLHHFGGVGRTLRLNGCPLTSDSEIGRNLTFHTTAHSPHGVLFLDRCWEWFEVPLLYNPLESEDLIYVESDRALRPSESEPRLLAWALDKLEVRATNSGSNITATIGPSGTSITGQGGSSWLFLLPHEGIKLVGRTHHRLKVQQQERATGGLSSVQEFMPGEEFIISADNSMVLVSQVTCQDTLKMPEILVSDLAFRRNQGLRAIIASVRANALGANQPMMWRLGTWAFMGWYLLLILLLLMTNQSGEPAARTEKDGF